MGGQKEDQHYLDSLYQLKDGDKSWTLMDKKLKMARSFHTAFLVSDCPHVIEEHGVDESVVDVHVGEELVEETTAAAAEEALESATEVKEEEEEVETTTAE